MNRALVAGCGALLVTAITAADAAAASVAVQPPRITLVGQASTALTVTNRDDAPARYALAGAGYALARDGRTLINPRRRPNRSSRSWIVVSPRLLSLRAGQSATVQVRSRPPRLARPGDHHSLVLITGAQPGSGAGVRVRAQVGIGVTVRVRGPLVRRLKVHRLTLRRSGSLRVFRIGISNLGNIDERFERGQIVVDIYRGRGRGARVASRARHLLPGTSALITVPYRGPVGGRVRAVARVRPAPARVAGPGVRSTPRPIVRGRIVRL